MANFWMSWIDPQMRLWIFWEILPTVIVHAPAADSGVDSSAVGDAVERLNRRLDEPFVTVNTVEGEHGIHRAYQEYDSLIKRSKSRYKR